MLLHLIRFLVLLLDPPRGPANCHRCGEALTGGECERRAAHDVDDLLETAWSSRVTLES